MVLFVGNTASIHHYNLQIHRLHCFTGKLPRLFGIVPLCMLAHSLYSASASQLISPKPSTSPKWWYLSGLTSPSGGMMIFRSLNNTWFQHARFSLPCAKPLAISVYWQSLPKNSVMLAPGTVRVICQLKWKEHGQHLHTDIKDAGYIGEWVVILWGWNSGYSQDPKSPLQKSEIRHVTRILREAPWEELCLVLLSSDSKQGLCSKSHFW